MKRKKLSPKTVISQTPSLASDADIMNKIESLMNKTYYNVAKPGSLGGVDPLLLHVQQLIRKAENVGSSQAKQRRVVEGWLATQDPYTLHRSQRYRFERNKMISKGIDDIWQSDLCDMQPLAKENDGARYLLIVIDTFSRYVWVRTLKNKTGLEVTSAFESILNNSKGRKPIKLCTDMGKEYLNSHFQKLLDSHGIHHYAMASDTKAAIVERFNRTLKERMWRYFTHIHPAPKRYIDVLQNLVESYNHSKHRIIGMSPAEVNKSNEAQLWNRQFAADAVNRELKKKGKFQVGDRVRVGEKKNPFEKGYWGNWSREIFTIKEINRLHRFPMYYLVDDRGETIKGGFYQQQLQKVLERDNDFNGRDANHKSYEIEKVIGRARKINGILHRYVQWKGFPKSHNQWIPASDITNIVPSK